MRGGQGDGKERGLNHLAHAGPGAGARSAATGAWCRSCSSSRSTNQIEAYNLPQGVIAHLFRDIAAGKPGHLSRIGLGTFVDPRHGGGKLNARTTDDLVSLMTIDGEEYLFYKTIPVDVAHRPRHHRRSRRQHHDGARGADAGDAVDRDGGAQLRRPRDRAGRAHRRRAARSTRARCKIPGILVDCVVVADAEHHQQTFATAYSAAYRRRDAGAGRHASSRRRSTCAR